MSENLVKRPLTEAEAVEGITWATNEIVSLRAKIERLTRLYDEVERMTEALTHIRNLVLCPVGPSPTIDELQNIASEALKLGSLDKGQ